MKRRGRKIQPRVQATRGGRGRQGKERDPVHSEGWLGATALRQLPQPVLYSQVLDAAELTLVIRDQRAAEVQCMRRDPQIIRTDRRALALEPSAERSV